MDEKQAVARLVRQVQEYARGRARDVARGAETPRLAALLLEKYGRGLADAAAEIFDSHRAADPVNLALHAEMSRIDPDWQEHARERWSARPADLDLSASPRELFAFPKPDDDEKPATFKFPLGPVEYTLDQASDGTVLRVLSDTKSTEE